MLITKDTIPEELLLKYPWIIDKLNEFNPELKTLIKTPLFNLVKSKSIHDLCKQFNVDETCVIKNANKYLSKWLGERNGNYLFNDIKNNKISTSKINWIIDKLLGSDCTSEDRTLVRIAILTTHDNMSDLTIKQLIQNIRNLDTLNRDSIWFNLIKDITVEQKNKVIQTLQQQDLS